MSFVPLHAARSRAGECMLDRVVSSYTPTLHALAFARRPAGEAPPRAVVVAPSGRGARALPAAVRESRAVAGLIGCPVTVLTGRRASRRTVTAEFGRCAWAHLTGHAWADPVFPTRSSFDVHDPDGTALSVADLTRLLHGTGSIPVRVHHESVGHAAVRRVPPSRLSVPAGRFPSRRRNPVAGA
jgi:hypothetical protein